MSLIKKSSSSFVVRPPNDSERVKALMKLKIVDNQDEEISKSLDTITNLAKRLLKFPMTAIGLIDEHRTLMQSCAGASFPYQQPRDETFCNYVVTSTEVMIVSDTLKDERFMNHPQVIGGAKLRFYAGAPIISKDGFPLGSLCVMDLIPREFSDEDVQSLKRLAGVVSNLLQQRSEKLKWEENKGRLAFGLEKLDGDRTKLAEAVNIFNEGYIFWDEKLNTKFVNNSFMRITGLSKEEIMKSVGTELLKFSSDNGTVQQAFEGKERVEFSTEFNRKDGRVVSLNVVSKPSFNSEGNLEGFHAFIKEIDESEKLKQDSNISKTALGKRPSSEEFTEPFPPSKRSNLVQA